MSLGIDYSCKGWLHQCPEAFRRNCVCACMCEHICVCVFAPLLFHLSIAASLRPSRDHGNQAKYFISAHLVTTDPSHSPRSRVPTPPRPRSSPQKKNKKNVPKLALTFFKWNRETALWLIMTAGAPSLRKRHAVIYQPTQWQLWGAPWKAFHRGAG